MKLSFDVEVRTYELDSYGHVNHAVYLNYFEYTRMKFIQAIGFDYEGLLNDGYYLYITKVNIIYKRSVVLNDVLSIEVEPIKEGAASGVYRQQAFNQRGELCAEADVTWACVDQKTGKPARLPEKYRLNIHKD
ncbi:acyl-CoA thioesterase [Treponema phagedenis]|uniref:Acyl-CoA thioesterase n=1 Tax=Treponema phagedenis TaxID=162 RepID=A0AAE6M642_TREPH|nr:thioesterase family protein [Treponema phagedenis]NVP24990.1 acyl-CoA thioesterase [Treponema phagedenis]QEJ97108.1 acyl-CoA thioesterase [Treponema phagedenis]QEK02702.1 acyl-CoA thioesterase [Treponema phagedenis]QEK08331.1 acyl-CoA thioesterase [Treponema phagedenis]QLC59304.1 acyl-CoA thioesterase [Treponema phagedenis]